MNKIIEQDDFVDLKIEDNEDCLRVYQNDDFLLIDKQGVSELINVLQEWVGDE